MTTLEGAIFGLQLANILIAAAGIILAGVGLMVGIFAFFGYNIIKRVAAKEALRVIEVEIKHKDLKTVSKEDGNNEQGKPR